MNLIKLIIILSMFGTQATSLAAGKKVNKVQKGGKLTLSLPQGPNQKLLSQLLVNSGSSLSVSMKNLKALQKKAQQYIKVNTGNPKFTLRLGALKNLDEIYSFCLSALKNSGNFTRQKSTQLVELLVYVQNSSQLFMRSKSRGWSNQQLSALSEITQAVKTGVKNKHLSSLNQVLIHFPKLKTSILNMSCAI